MNQVKFQIEGVEGDFFVDADELNNYRTIKQLSFSEKNPSGMFEAMERIYMGHDEEYANRVGGMDELGKLNDAAVTAVNAKKASVSSHASKSSVKK